MIKEVFPSKIEIESKNQKLLRQKSFVSLLPFTPCCCSRSSSFLRNNIILINHKNVTRLVENTQIVACRPPNEQWAIYRIMEERQGSPQAHLSNSQTLIGPTTSKHIQFACVHECIFLPYQTTTVRYARVESWWFDRPLIVLQLFDISPIELWLFSRVLKL